MPIKSVENAVDASTDTYYVIYTHNPNELGRSIPPIHSLFFLLPYHAAITLFRFVVHRFIGTKENKDDRHDHDNERIIRLEHIFQHISLYKRTH